MSTPPAAIVPGERYGHMVVLREAKKTLYGGRWARQVLVRCDCGDVIAKVFNDLRGGVKFCNRDCPLNPQSPDYTPE